MYRILDNPELIKHFTVFSIVRNVHSKYKYKNSLVLLGYLDLDGMKWYDTVLFEMVLVPLNGIPP